MSYSHKVCVPFWAKIFAITKVDVLNITVKFVYALVIVDYRYDALIFVTFGEHHFEIVINLYKSCQVFYLVFGLSTFETN